MLAERTHRHRRERDAGMLERRLGAQAEVDLLGERHREGITLYPRPVRAALRLEGGERAASAAAGRPGERAGPRRGLGRAPVLEAAVGREAPCSFHEHPHADALALHVVEGLDAAVLRPDVLCPPADGAGIRVRRSGGDRRLDRRGAQSPHAGQLNRRRRRQTARPQLQWPRSARWWRNW